MKPQTKPTPVIDEGDDDNIVNIDFGALGRDRKLSPAERKAADEKFETFEDLPLEVISISLLRSDNRYQTPVVDSIVENIVENFSQAAVNPPLVSRRADGTLWVIDGQHTIKSHVILGRIKIACKVVDGLTLKDEADLFLIRNDPASRRKLSKKQSFKARVEAGDTTAVAMNRVFKQSKWTLHGRGPMKITSVPQAEDCFALDKGRSFALALADADNAWPNRTGPINFLMITTLTHIHYNGARLGKKPDPKRLRMALGFNLKAHKRNGQYPILTPTSFVDFVKDTLKAKSVPNARYMPRLLGDEILAIYNFGLSKADRLTDEYLEGLVPQPVA